MGKEGGVRGGGGAGWGWGGGVGLGEDRNGNGDKNHTFDAAPETASPSRSGGRPRSGVFSVQTYHFSANVADRALLKDSEPQ